MHLLDYTCHKHVDFVTEWMAYWPWCAIVERSYPSGVTLLILNLCYKFIYNVFNIDCHDWHAQKTYMHTHTQKHTRAHARTHARTHAHTHTHTYSHTHILWKQMSNPARWLKLQKKCYFSSAALKLLARNNCNTLMDRKMYAIDVSPLYMDGSNIQRLCEMQYKTQFFSPDGSTEIRLSIC